MKRIFRERVNTGRHYSGGFGVSGGHQKDAGLLKSGERQVRGGGHREEGYWGDLIEGEQKRGGCFSAEGLCAP